MSNTPDGCKIKPKQNLAKSFRVAFSGIVNGLRCERNFQIHVIITIVVLILLIILQASVLEWAVIILAIVAVMTLELVNTALEQLIDFLNPDIHPIIRVVKDMVGGAVLVAAIGAAAIGLIIIVPKILELISQTNF